MVIDKAALEELMAPLRRKYMAQVKEWLAELTLIRQHLEAGQFAPSDREALKYRTHGLLGSGSTYGFTNITEAAQALEDELAREEDKVKIAGLLANLIMTCRRAV